MIKYIDLGDQPTNYIVLNFVKVMFLKNKSIQYQIS